MDQRSLDRELSFLFSRLTLVSGMVRERTCVAIADLIINSQESENIQRKLLDWIKKQTLESFTVIGLLVFCRIQIQSSDCTILSLPQFIAAINQPSILSWMLLNELFSDGVPVPDWKILHSGTAPSEFRANSFFTKYSSNFLPPIYTEYAKRIETIKQIPFQKQWAFEWQKILEVAGKEPSRNALDFWGRPDYDHYEVFDTAISEVYRSAYLRSLAWAVSTGAISDKDAKVFAAKTCPIDLGLWHITPGTKPNWWIKVDEPESEIDTVPGQIWQQLEKVWQQQVTEKNEWIVAEAGGRVYEKRNTAAYDLDIFGLFQTCQGSSVADIGKIADWYCRDNFVREQMSSSIRFEGFIEHISPSTFAETFGDWLVVPASIPVWPNTVPRWQSWRVRRNIWLPAPFLAREMLRFYCSDDALIIQEGENTVAKWIDWADGLGEKISANLSPSTGQHMLIQRKRIQEFMEATDSVFCWICRLTVYNRKYDGSPYDKFYDYSHYGATSIVRRLTF